MPWVSSTFSLPVFIKIRRGACASWWGRTFLEMATIPRRAPFTSCCCKFASPRRSLEQQRSPRVQAGAHLREPRLQDPARTRLGHTIDFQGCGLLQLELATQSTNQFLEDEPTSYGTCNRTCKRRRREWLNSDLKQGSPKREGKSPRCILKRCLCWVIPWTMQDQCTHNWAYPSTSKKTKSAAHVPAYHLPLEPSEWVSEREISSPS